MEEGKYHETDRGTAQGSPISLILANVYLHYVLDVWFAYLKKHNAFKGEAYIVRYADDFIMLFQYKSDAEKVYKKLPKRLGKFGLELAMDKTKIMTFGRFAKQNSKDGRTETLIFWDSFKWKEWQTDLYSDEQEETQSQETSGEGMAERTHARTGQHDV